MSKLPEAVFIFGLDKDITCAREAKRKGIKIVSIVDTNVNPDIVDYPIPANDDAVGSIKVLVDALAAAAALSEAEGAGPRRQRDQHLPLILRAPRALDQLRGFQPLEQRCQRAGIEQQPLDVGRVRERIGEREFGPVRGAPDRDLVDPERNADGLRVVRMIARAVEVARRAD